MSTPNQPQDPYSAPDGQGGGQQPGGVPPYPGGTPEGGPAAPGGLPGYGQYPAQPPAGEPGAYPQGGQYPQAGPYPQAGQYPQAGPAGYGPGYYPKNNLAVWSLVLGLVGLVLCGFLTSIPGIIVGSRAKKAVAAGEANNGSLANAGYIVSWIVTGLTVLGAIVAIGLIAAGVWDWNTNSNFDYRY